MNGIWSKLGYLEGFSIRSGVGADSCVFTLGGSKTGSTLLYGAGMLVISGGWKFSFWLCGSIGGNSKFFMWG